MKIEELRQKAWFRAVKSLYIIAWVMLLGITAMIFSSEGYSHVEMAISVLFIWTVMELLIRGFFFYTLTGKYNASLNIAALVLAFVIITYSFGVQQEKEMPEKQPVSFEEFKAILEDQ